MFEEVIENIIWEEVGANPVGEALDEMVIVGAFTFGEALAKTCEVCGDLEGPSKSCTDLDGKDGSDKNVWCARPELVDSKMTAL